MYFNVEFILYNVFSIHIHVFYYFTFVDVRGNEVWVIQLGACEKRDHSMWKWESVISGVMNFKRTVITLLCTQCSVWNQDFHFSSSFSSPMINENKCNYAECVTHTFIKWQPQTNRWLQTVAFYTNMQKNCHCHKFNLNSWFSEATNVGYLIT